MSGPPAAGHVRRGLVAVMAAALVVPASGAGDPANPPARAAASSGTIAFYRFPKLLDSRRTLKRARGSCRICGVYTMHGDGRAEKPFPHLSGRRLDLIANDLRWSPDGGRLAAVRTGGLHENNVAEIYTIARDGSDRRTVAISRTEEGAVGHGEWSPDGTQLVYTRGLDVVVGDARGGGERKLDRGDLQTLTGPDWSPDGTQVATIGIRAGPNGLVSGVWLVDLATGGLSNVIEWQGFSGDATAI